MDVRTDFTTSNIAVELGRRALFSIVCGGGGGGGRMGGWSDGRRALVHVIYMRVIIAHRPVPADVRAGADVNE